MYSNSWNTKFTNISYLPSIQRSASFPFPWRQRVRAVVAHHEPEAWQWPVLPVCLKVIVSGPWTRGRGVAAEDVPNPCWYACLARSSATQGVESLVGCLLHPNVSCLPGSLLDRIPMFIYMLVLFKLGASGNQPHLALECVAGGVGPGEGVSQRRCAYYYYYYYVWLQEFQSFLFGITCTIHIMCKCYHVLSRCIWYRWFENYIVLRNSLCDCNTLH